MEQAVDLTCFFLLTPKKTENITQSYQKRPSSMGVVLLLMEEILHHLIGSSSHYLQVVFLHPRWLAGFLPSTVRTYFLLTLENHVLGKNTSFLRHTNLAGG